MLKLYVDLPPGTINTSTSGAFANVCVGTIFCPNELDTKLFGSGLVDTGSNDSAKTTSSISCFLDSTFKVLRGPKTSVGVEGQINANPAWKIENESSTLTESLESSEDNHAIFDGWSGAMIHQCDHARRAIYRSVKPTDLMLMESQDVG